MLWARWVSLLRVAAGSSLEGARGSRRTACTRLGARQTGMRGGRRQLAGGAAGHPGGLQGTVIVERWWKVPLAKKGRQPRIKHRRFRVYRLVEDTKHRPKEPLELILTETVEDVGSRGDIVFVDRSFGRNRLLPQNLAVYASPENKQMFEEENRLRREGKLEKLQTHTGIKTVRFLQNCHLDVGVGEREQWELTKEIVARQFLRNLGVVVPLHTLKLPEEPITELGEYWCEVTVNSLDTIRVPMSVVSFAEPKSKGYRRWLTRQTPPPTPQQ